MDSNENAEWGLPLYAGECVPIEMAAPADSFHKMHCDVRFIRQCIAMAPANAVAYYDPPDGGELLLIVNYREAREGTSEWAILIQDESAPRVLKPTERIFVTNMPGVAGKTMNEVLAECQATLQSKSKTP